MEKETKKKTTNKKSTTAKSTNKKTNSTKNVAKKGATKTATKNNNVKKQADKKVEAKVVLPKEVTPVQKTEEIKKVKEVKNMPKLPKEKKASMPDNEMTKLFKIVLIIAAALLILYFVTAFLKKDTKKTKEEETPNAIVQYEEILSSNIFNQNTANYFVLVYSKEDNYVGAYNTYLNVYKYKENSMKVLKVDMDSDFNSYIVGKKSNLYVSNSKDLKVTGTTLLKISDGNVVEAYEGKDDLFAYLKSMSQ